MRPFPATNRLEASCLDIILDGIRFRSDVMGEGLFPDATL